MFYCVAKWLSEAPSPQANLHALTAASETALLDRPLFQLVLQTLQYLRPPVKVKHPLHHPHVIRRPAHLHRFHQNPQRILRLLPVNELELLYRANQKISAAFLG